MHVRLFLSVVLGMLLIPAVYACCDLERIASQFDVEVTISDPLSIEDVERIERTKNGLDQASAPFDRLDSQWESLKEEMRDGDCLVHFKTSDTSWREFAGREGYLLVREGEIVMSIVTKMN